MQRARQRLSNLLQDQAPSLAAALGGPLAGAAVSFLAEALLGRSDAGEEELAETIERAGSALLPELRRAALDFEVAALKAATAGERIAADDRADARARQIAMGDRIPGLLAIVILTGFFCVLVTMLVRRVPEGAETEFSIMLGALATMAAAVMNYYFGSSAGSREKTFLLRGDGAGHKPSERR